MQAQAIQENLFDDLPDKAAEKKLSHFEDCASAIDLLFQQALDKDQGGGVDAFDEFTAKMCRFTNLSAYNAMLVMVQSILST
ncbi:MAG: hypothetical protein Q8O37_12065 [Sulfuricellaceae bacterium]|nr:hypothetical protein [Sulfuricellaceae bacterium]